MPAFSKLTRRLCFLATSLLAVCVGSVVAAQSADELAALNAEVVSLFGRGRYAEATEVARRAVTLAETRGADHPDLANALNNLAELHRTQGRLPDAEPLFVRALGIRERAFGAEHPTVGTSLNNLAALYKAQGRLAEAEPLQTRSLALFEALLGPAHPTVGIAINNLAGLYRAQGRLADAEPLYVRALRIAETASGPEHPSVGTASNNLASLREALGRYREAEPLYERGIAISERASGKDHPNVGRALDNLAGLYKAQGRFVDAERLNKRTIAIFERTYGPDHASVGAALNNLADLYRTQGRVAEAEPLYRRAIDVLQTALGADHPSVGIALNNLAELYRLQRRFAEARPLFERALSLRERTLGADHPDVATALNNLAILLQTTGADAEAERLHERALAIRVAALGGAHPDVAASLGNLAELFRARGRLQEAGWRHRRALEITEQAFGPDHPRVAAALHNLASLSLGENDRAAAADHWRRATSVLRRRATISLGAPSGGLARNEAQRNSIYFQGLVKTSWRLAVDAPAVPSPHARATATATEMFETAQWGTASAAAASLAQMAARSAAASPEIGPLVRERQDLVSEWQAKDTLLIAAKSAPTAKRIAIAETALSDRLAAIDGRLAAIDTRFSADFPDYAALSSPRPVSVADVQAALRPDEALVQFLDTTADIQPLPEETFVWVVTKTDVRWVRSDLGTAALGREVAALRCGLDATAWNEPADSPGDTDTETRAKAAQRARAGACAAVVAAKPTEDAAGRTLLPFDHARAHRLYTALFGAVRDLIRDRHLLLVPSGALTQLPFQVLVSEPGGGDRLVRWLAEDHAMTVLPAVSSLRSLRRDARPSAAARPMIGFGNPLLNGQQDHPDPSIAAYAREQAALARTATACPERPKTPVAARISLRRSASAAAMIGGLADVAHLRLQAPLPETATELCEVAAAVQADAARDIHLGARATERAVKRLSAATFDGRLSNYRIVHFAAHGLLAGQLAGIDEPGLILTPPDRASAEDDGYLSASEIAGLKLDADLVILSACNTAGPAGGATGGDGGSDGGAEALSGLARAFFYAGARALLVSHWEVDSAAAVQLITVAVGAMTRDPTVGRAEALRRAMRAMIGASSAYEAHPATWAPFVVVGEGAAVG